MSKHRSIRSLLILNLLIAAALLADTATLAPTGDNTTDSWTTTPLWSKIAEDIDSPDGTTIISPNNPVQGTNDIIFSVACGADVDTITEANLRARGKKQLDGARAVSFTFVWSATNATNGSTGTLTTTMTNYGAGNKTGLSISKSACDASLITISPTNFLSGSPSSIAVDTLNLDITYTPTGGGPPRNRAVVISMATRWTMACFVWRLPCRN